MDNGSIGFLSFLYVNTQNTFDLQTNNNRKQVMKKLSISLFSIFFHLSNINAQWTSRFNGQGDFSDVYNAIITNTSGISYQAGYTINPETSKDILLVKLNTSGDTIWTRIINGAGNGPDEATAITLDNAGNILITGYLKGSGTGYDIATIKFDANGNILWTSIYNYTSNEFDQGNAITTDASGNIYIAGQSDKDASLNNNDDFLIIKYNSAGIQQWTKRSNGFGNATDRPTAMVITSDGDIVVTGRSSNGNDDDYMTIKYEASTGNELWRKYFDRTHHDRATSIVCNNINGKIYITGRSNNGDNYDYATLCYDADGIQMWQAIFDYVNDDRATNIGIDASGNIYVTGQSDVNAAAIAVDYDILTVKYNSAGIQQFAQSFGGDAANDDIPTSMIVDNAGNITVAGSTDTDPSTQIKNDLIVLRYNNTGTLQWSTNFSAGALNNNIARSIGSDGSGNIFISGYSEVVPDKNALTIKINNTGNVEWDNSYNGIGDNADNVHAILYDVSNSMYLAGYTFGYESDRNFMVMKLGATGNILWKNEINGSSNTQSTDDALAMATDNSGNIYATGYVKNSGTGYDMMLVKYSATGDSIWAQQYNYGIANETDKAIGIAISNDNKIYITGRSDQDAGIISNDDIVTIKYSSAGIVEWTNRFNGIGNGIDNVKSIKVSSAGNIYVVGKTFSGSDLDIVLIKYNASGVQQWVKTFNGSFGDDEGIAMTIDSEENIFVVGESFNSDANKDIILLHYSSAGSLLWSQQYDGIENGNDEAKSICLDSNGNIIIAATTSPDTASATLNGDITLLKFSGDGSLIWEETYINELNDDASEAVVDSENNIFITGQTDNGSGGNIDYNYVTLSYSQDGILTDEQVYDGTGHASDVPNTLLAKENGFYVAGGSYGETSQRDIVTILYGTTPQDIHFFDNEKSNITVFPNPVQTNFTLQFPQNDFLTGSAINILITDLSGRLVRSVTSQYNQNILLNRGTIPAGAYLINITAAGSVIAHATIIFN